MVVRVPKAFSIRKKIRVFIIGVSGAGKTLLLSNFYEALAGREGGPARPPLVGRVWADRRLTEAADKTRSEQWPDKTPPEGVEVLQFEYGQRWLVEVVAYSGETLRAEGCSDPGRVVELVRDG